MCMYIQSVCICMHQIGEMPNDTIPECKWMIVVGGQLLREVEDVGEGLGCSCPAQLSLFCIWVNHNISLQCNKCIFSAPARSFDVWNCHYVGMRAGQENKSQIWDLCI